MNKLNWQVLLTVAAVALAGPVYAEEDNDGDTSNTTEEEMEVVMAEEGDDPEDIIKLLELPENASDTGRINSAKGLETANLAREDGRAFGQAMAEGRGEAGRAIGEAAREAAADIAKEARESASDRAQEARDKAANMRPENAGRP